MISLVCTESYCLHIYEAALRTDTEMRQSTLVY